MTDIIEALALTAAEYRRSYRLTDDYPIEVRIPGWYGRLLIERHGSLQAAADSVFRAGAIRLVDDYWYEQSVEAKQRAVEYLALGHSWPILHLSDFGDLTRIAFDAT